MNKLVWLVLPLAACGRSGFDELPPVDAQAPPPVIACAETPRFTLAGSTTRLAAASTSSGYVVASVDPAGKVTGASYQFATDDPLHPLVAGATASPLATGVTGSVGLFASGDDVALEVVYGPSPAGTALIPLTGQLATQGPVSRVDGWNGGAGMLAYLANGDAATLGQSMTNGEIDGNLITASGVSVLANSVPLVLSAAGAVEPTVSAAGAKLAVAWHATPSNEIDAQLFDGQLVARSGVIKVNPTPLAGSNGPGAPRVAYAAAADRYLFAWYEKTSSGDQIWISLRDGNLGDLGISVMLAAQGRRPIVAASDDDFLVAWEDGGSPNKLSAARVRSDGAATALGVASTGGSAVGWDVVSHAGQPALVWIESGGTGPNLWFDPLCH